LYANKANCQAVYLMLCTCNLFSSRPVASPHSWLFILLPSLFLPLSLPFPSHSPPLPSFPSSPVPLKVGPPIAARGLGEHLSSPSGSRQSPAAKRFLVNCRLQIAPVFRRFTRDNTYMIDRKKNAIRYLVSHNIPSIVQWDPEVSVP